MSLKEKIFIVIDKGNEGTVWSKRFDAFILTIIILSTLAIILESYHNLRDEHWFWLRIFEVTSIFIFSIEYILRLWTADLKYNTSWRKAAPKFIFSFMGIVDLLAIIPFFLPLFTKIDLRFIRIIRMMKILRLLKLNRYFESLNMIGLVIREKKEDLGVTIFLTFFLVLIASVLMYNVEGDVQPEAFPNIVATFWWAIATLTTVGYGDVFPVTNLGKIISSIIALLGIGLVALPTGIISAAYLDLIEEKRNSQKKKPKIYNCPHCNQLISADKLEEHKEN